MKGDTRLEHLSELRWVLYLDGLRGSFFMHAIPIYIPTFMEL